MSLKILKVILLLPLVFVVSNCVTPMSSSEVEGLTTCKNITLKDVRKNLLLAGFEVDQSTSDDLITKWKQTSGFSNDKSLIKIVVVKLDEKSIKFRVRKRQSSVTQENQLSFSSTNKSKNVGTSQQQTIGFGRDVERHSDYDESYYKEYYEKYADIQHDVCG